MACALNQCQTCIHDFMRGVGRYYGEREILTDTAWRDDSEDASAMKLVDRSLL